MVLRTLRIGVLAAALLALSASIATASDLSIQAHFTQHFGGRNGELAPCPNDELISERAWSRATAARPMRS